MQSDALQINLKVLEELGRRILRDGGQFAVVDASAPFSNPSSTTSMHLSRALERLCAREGFGYVPLGGRMVQAARNGQRLRWKHDPHFNEAGNANFAEALHEWMVEHLPSPFSSQSAAGTANR